jgi:hypothetical protein
METDSVVDISILPQEGVKANTLFESLYSLIIQLQREAISPGQRAIWRRSIQMLLSRKEGESLPLWELLAQLLTYEELKTLSARKQQILAVVLYCCLELAEQHKQSISLGTALASCSFPALRLTRLLRAEQGPRLWQEVRSMVSYLCSKGQDVDLIDIAHFLLSQQKVRERRKKQIALDYFITEAKNQS